MLKIRQNSARFVADLGGIWDFKLGGSTDADGDEIHGRLTGAEPMAVPASYNEQHDRPEYRDHYGWVYYQREFELPSFIKGQRIWLRFDAVFYSAKVWIDGSLICTHEGGFLPFEAEVTDMAVPGKSVLLTVAVDNRLNHATLPAGNDPTETAFFGSDNAGIPSVEQAKQEQKPLNRPNFDFFPYAGIFRPVSVYTTPQDYIKDITIVTDLNGKVDFEVITDGSGEIKIDILDGTGSVVASGGGERGTLSVSAPTLWEPWPGTPYLYTARITLKNGNSTDRYDQPFGFRTVRVEKDRFLINEKPFYFKGFGKHEDSFFRGRGLDNCLNVKDVNLIHWLNANSFRTSHYPYAEEMYDLCDREGIVVIDETAAVGLNMSGKDNPYDKGSEAPHREMIKELIARDKNHPCVVMWSLGNEPDLEHYPDEAYDYWTPLYELAHSEDPQNRPVTLVCCQNDYTKDKTTMTMDVVCLNRYYGWYNLSGDLDAACNGLNIELDFWEKLGKPVMLTEYGADAVAGLHQTVPSMFSEEYQAEYYERINHECDKRSFFIGEQLWNFADFATIQGTMRVGGNKKGIFTRDRTPKLAAHIMKRRWAGIPNFGYKG